MYKRSSGALSRGVLIIKLGMPQKLDRDPDHSELQHLRVGKVVPTAAKLDEKRQ